MKTKEPSRAYFYRCSGCGLRYPSLEEQSRCPGCGAGVELQDVRVLEPDDYSQPRSLVEPPCCGVLENLRSAWNVGSIFRIAEAAGLSEIHLCGITPTPPHPGIGKTALGAEETVPWDAHRDAVALLRKLRQEGWVIWGLETEGSILWHPDLVLPSAPLALVVGNELVGIDPAVLSLCHQVVRLPMRGGKRSLNVSVAFGVLALWVSSRRSTPR